MVGREKALKPAIIRLKIYERQTNLYNIVNSISISNSPSKFDQSVLSASFYNYRPAHRSRRAGHYTKKADYSPELSDHRKFSLYAGKSSTGDNAVFC